MPDPDGLDALSLGELRGLVVDLIGQVRALTDENRTLRDEVVRLKGPRPPTRPTPPGMEAAGERVQSDPGHGSGSRWRGRCARTAERALALKAALRDDPRQAGSREEI